MSSFQSVGFAAMNSLISSIQRVSCRTYTTTPLCLQIFVDGQLLRKRARTDRPSIVIVIVVQILIALLACFRFLLVSLLAKPVPAQPSQGERSATAAM